MTPKKRVKIAMRKGKPDRVPVLPQICPPHAVRVSGLPYRETVVDRLRHPEKYELLVSGCAVKYGADALRLSPSKQPQQIEWNGKDAHGVDPATGQSTGIVDFEGSGEVIQTPRQNRLLGEADIEAIEIESISNILTGEALHPLVSIISRYGRQFFLVGMSGNFALDTMYPVQGMEQTLMDIMDRGEFVQHWIERRFEFVVQQSIAMAKLGVDALAVGETFGQFLSPAQFERFCLPYYQQFCEVMHRYDMVIFLHMCGRITHLLDLIAETGVDVIEPLDEVGGTTVREIKDKLGDKLAMFGGVNTVLLAQGTLAEVIHDSKRCIAEAGQDGGYMLGACDMLPTETSPEKVKAMIECACTFGRYDTK